MSSDSPSTSSCLSRLPAFMLQWWLAWSCSGLMQVTADGLSAWVWWPCCDQKTAFTALFPVAFFLTPLLQCFSGIHLPTPAIKSPSFPFPPSDHHLYPAISLYLPPSLLYLLCFLSLSPLPPFSWSDHLWSAVPLSIASLTLHILATVPFFFPGFCSY